MVFLSNFGRVARRPPGPSPNTGSSSCVVLRRLLTRSTIYTCLATQINGATIGRFAWRHQGAGRDVPRYPLAAGEHLAAKGASYLRHAGGVLPARPVSQIINALTRRHESYC